MASYVSINLHNEFTQTRLAFCPPGLPPCRFVFVIPGYVKRGAQVSCSALPQNVFRIRNLILPRALLALDQSAHLQISEQINAAVLQASAFFFPYPAICSEPVCSVLVTSRAEWGGRVRGGGGCKDVGTPAGCDKCARHCRKSKRSRGYLTNFKSVLGGDSLAAIPIFTERFRASQLTGQKGKDSLCVGDEWQHESWPSVGLWSVMRNKESVGPSKSKSLSTYK